MPAGRRAGVADAAREGFLAGMNEILMLGGILAIAGALAALWLIREGDIERGEASSSRSRASAMPEPCGVARTLAARSRSGPDRPASPASAGYLPRLTRQSTGR